MATVPVNDPLFHDTRLQEDDYPRWKASFSTLQRKSMIDEDLWAGRSVSAVLASVVTIGVILALLTVFWWTA